MIPIAKLKHNLDFNKNLGELIEVMKLAATSQFNQFRNRQEPGFEFLSPLEAAFNCIPRDRLNHFLFTPPAGLPSAIVLISSDEGFLGELNTFLVNKVLELRKEDDRIFVLGQQGANYLEDLKINFIKLAAPSEKIGYSHAQAIRDNVLKYYLKKKIGKVYIIYARFINITLQQVEAQVLLPLPGSSIAQAGAQKEVILEPDFNAVIEGWVKLWVGFRIYQALWSAKLAEFAARIMHLEGSIQELNRINQHLKLEYFKYMHAVSDKTIREISSSRILWKH